MDHSKNTKYFIFLDNSGSMSSYYKNVKSNLCDISDELNEINPTILSFNSSTEEIQADSFRDKIFKNKNPNGTTYITGVIEKFLEYLTEEAELYEKIYILFITDGDVQDLREIRSLLLTCLDVIISKKISVYMSCIAINSSADMKAFSLLGILNNFSIFQLIKSKNGGGSWSTEIVKKIHEINTCDTSLYNSIKSSDFLYNDIMVDVNITEKGKNNKVFLASLVQAFTICNFTTKEEDGFLKCKRLLKYIADLGINTKTRYIWNKLNTAKMVGNKDSNVIANEFLSTINDVDNKEEYKKECNDDTNKEEEHFISITNEHDVRIRFFVGKEKSFSTCLPITMSAQNQVAIQSKGASELFLNIEVYHPLEPVDLEISYGDNKHRWYIPYGVSLIEGDVKYLMLAHENYKESSDCTDEEKLFNFIVKAVPSSMTIDSSIDVPDSIPIERPIPIAGRAPKKFKEFCCYKKSSSSKKSPTSFADTRFADSSPASFACKDSSPARFACKDSSYRLQQSNEEEGFANIGEPDIEEFSLSSKAFPTVSKETRKIDTVRREVTFDLNSQVLCFSFIFVSDITNFANERLSDIIYTTKECVICLNENSTIKLKCNHKCFCADCYQMFIHHPGNHNCPLCRQEL